MDSACSAMHLQSPAESNLCWNSLLGVKMQSVLAEMCTTWIHFWSSCGASNGNMHFTEWHVAGSSSGSTQDAHAGLQLQLQYLICMSNLNSLQAATPSHIIKM